MERIFSGIQPSGVIHLGNYLGAIKNWVALQDDYESIFCIVDLHAITVPQEPKELREAILLNAATYLACGVDPRKSVIFVQSQRPEHSELAWILMTIARMGELQRMTQFKEKTEGAKEVGVGLFAYPALMAADILLYQTNLVPVGEDQKQHIELTRDLALRFNKRFGEIFTLPEPFIQKGGARITGLDSPTKKMSKSAGEANYIALTDSPDVIRQKITRAVTDSGSEVKAGPDKPALTNLLTITSLLSEVSIPELEKKYQGKGYAEFKKDLAEIIIERLNPIREKIEEYLKNKDELQKILAEGSEKIAPLAQSTLKEVKTRVGLG